jgi:hypothetical protein
MGVVPLAPKFTSFLMLKENSGKLNNIAIPNDINTISPYFDSSRNIKMVPFCPY